MFWNNKVVAVTGSQGFVGSAIVKKLKEHSVPVVEISRRTGIDVLNFSQLVEALRPVNYIISTAAIDGNKEFKKENSSQILATNIQITNTLLSAASQLGITDLTVLSSAVVYGQGVDTDYDENYDLIKQGHVLTDGYALSKRVTELLALEYASKYKGHVLIPRPTNIYSNGDPHMRVIETLIKGISAEQPIKIWGDGKQIRNFIYLEDFASILLKLIEKQASGIINIANPEKVSLIQLATVIAECLHKPLQIKYVYNTVKQPDMILDISLLESLLQYDYTPLKEGIFKSITNSDYAKKILG